MAACANRNRRNPHGERDVGVGGGAIGAGADSEMGIDGAQGQQQRRVVFQLAGRAAADLANLRCDLAADSPRVFNFFRARDRGVQGFGESFDAPFVFGTNVDFHTPQGRDCVDPGTALDEAGIHGNAW